MLHHNVRYLKENALIIANICGQKRGAYLDLLPAALSVYSIHM